MIGLTILLIIATTYGVLTGLSDFPELAHLTLTKILFKYCYYPPFYRQGNCGPEVLSGWQEVRIPFPCLSVRSEFKAQGYSHCPMRVVPRGCSGVQAGTEQPALLTLPTWRPPANQKLHCGTHNLTQAPTPEALGQRGGWLHQGREGAKAGGSEGKAASEAEAKSPGTRRNGEREGAAGSDKEEPPRPGLREARGPTTSRP